MNDLNQNAVDQLEMRVLSAVRSHLERYGRTPRTTHEVVEALAAASAWALPDAGRAQFIDALDRHIADIRGK
jgi:hypothetical protein